jgi:hypothetical protein
MGTWRWLAFPAAAAALLFAATPAAPAATEDAVHIKSHVSYDVRPGQEPVRVMWDVTFENNDPQTTAEGEDPVFFYENLTIPVLRGASAVSATSSSGEPLAVSLSEPGRSPTVSAYVSFNQAVFYGESYSFSLSYELANVRAPSLLVTPSYVYLPVIAGGDESTVTVSSPAPNGWNVTLEPGQCTQNGTTFTCAGADAAFLAAVLEVSRPDATASFAFDVPVGTKNVSVTMNYFQGEAGAAQHLKELVTTALPLIEDLYGFAYPGPSSVRVAQGGQRAVLGYEGITSCGQLGNCSVIVSPAADDITVLHELAHLWSSIYGKRWLSEGFAQLIAEEAAGALPSGLVQSQPPEKEPPTTNLRLDEWGDVSSLIGANESALNVENAGYDRSQRFLHLLQAEVGTGALRQVNAALAPSGAPADSKRYLDLVEKLSGKRVDNLFAEWVFPPAIEPVLMKRRQAQQRLQELIRLAADKDLSSDLPDNIRANMDAWRFDNAIAATDEAESKLSGYDGLKQALSDLTRDAETQSLSVPPSISDAIHNWEFEKGRQMLSDADRAIDAYASSRERLDTRRSLWKRLGLVGADPHDDLTHASEAFARGDFRAALDHANQAAEKAEGASHMAFRKLLVLTLVFAVCGGGIGITVWISRKRDEQCSPL